MDLTRRQKYTGHTHTVSKVKEKLKLNFDLNALNLFCSYITSSNRNIKRSQLINMRNLFDVMDKSEYKDDERSKRITFIEKGLEARLVYGLNDPDMIIKQINGGFVAADLIDRQNFYTISNTELEWINGTIAKTLDNAFALHQAPDLITAATNVLNSDYRTMDAAVMELKNVIVALNAEFRRNQARAVSDERFSLRDEPFESSVIDVHTALSNPSSKLKTMMQGLNEMLNGGFENQRVYMFFGLPGEGKSTTLLDLALQIKKANKGFTAKDPTKVPCVVLLTMENSVRETIERMWDMLCDREDMTHYTIEDVMRILREEGELYLSDDNPIDIIIKFVPGESVDTGYLYTLVEDLEDEGYECICLIQDYIKKIRPVYNSNSEVRVQYGSVVNEFKTFATIKDISVISASQLNRDATKHIDEGRRTNKTDLVKLLGRSNIGESQLILENIDAGYLIAPEWDINGKKYMGIQKIKSRFKPTLLNYIFQPYTDRCEIKFIEDLCDEVPAYKLTLRPTDSEQLQRFNQNTNAYRGNQIKNINDIKLLDEAESNIYNANATNRFISNAPPPIVIGKPHMTIPQPVGKRVMSPFIKNRISPFIK